MNHLRANQPETTAFDGLPGGETWPHEAPHFPVELLGAPCAAADIGSKFDALDTTGSNSLGQWIDRLRNGAAHADRRNCPDLLGQLTAALRRPIDSVLCSVLDVDPHACINTALASQYPVELAVGTGLLARIVGARDASIVLDSRAPGAFIDPPRRAAKLVTISESGAPVRTTTIINNYPQADPTLMLYALLRRRLRPGRLPSERGVIVIDAAAAFQIGRVALGTADALLRNRPLVVRDHLADTTYFVAALAGSSVGELLSTLTSPTPRGRFVIRRGDALRDDLVLPGAAIDDGELVFHVSPPAPPVNPDPCVRCGWCVEACPTDVHPAMTLDAVQELDLELADRAGIGACIECGICSYVCPSKLPLLSGIRKLRRLERETLVGPETSPPASMQE